MSVSSTRQLGTLTLFLVASLIVCGQTASAAILEVVNNHDSGEGSLRWAIAAASTGDTIAFEIGDSGESILLTSGSLRINESINIQGPGASELSIDGNANQFQPFTITGPDVNVDISGLTIQNGGGGSTGGGIQVVFGTLTLTDCLLAAVIRQIARAVACTALTVRRHSLTAH